MDFHGKKLIGSSPLAIHKPAPIPEISRLSLPVNLLLYRRLCVTKDEGATLEFHAQYKNSA
jgi:hypothetical protein